ncbi:MAG: hypothetical protein JXQ30_10190 [Spirochaetes bacterium]|nr:hypothetical protein [Spirochaetota bacterium]
MSDSNGTSAKAAKKPKNRISNYIPSIIFNIALLVVLNKIPDWNIVFITESYPDILRAVNTALIVHIAGNLILIFIHPLVIHHLANAFFSIFSLIAAWVILSVFPFDFSEIVGYWLNTLVRVCLIIGVVGSAISIVVHVVKAVFAVFKK